jgi:hypothetical protein
MESHVRMFIRISHHTRKTPYVKAEEGRLRAESTVFCDILHTWTSGLPCHGGRLSGKYDLTGISNSSRILPTYKESFPRVSIVMSAQSLQRIAMFDLWREFPITDASARGSAYAGGVG